MSQTTGTHAVLTGPIKGSVTLENGTEVDVTSPIILVDSIETAEEVGFLIGERFAEEGHPDLIERDEKGALVQRPFENTVPKRFAKHPGRFKGTPVGTPRKG